MTGEQLKKVMEKIEDHEKRIRVLESGRGEDDGQIKTPIDTRKQLTLAEIIRGKRFDSGQQKVAVIVGYYEKNTKKNPVKEIDLKDGWKSGKFDGKYDRNLLDRAIKDGLVRNIDTNLDLSQTGERFFEDFLKSNVRDNQTGAEK